MARPPSLEAAVRTIVRHEVWRVLLPYRDILRRLTLAFGLPSHVAGKLVAPQGTRRRRRRGRRK